MQRKVSLKEVAIYLMLLISIFPAYYHIAGRMVSSVILVPITFLTALTLGAKSKLNSKEFIIVLLWMIIKSFIYMYHGEALRAASFSLLVVSISIIVPAYTSSKDRFVHIIDMMLSASALLCLLGIIEGVTGFNPFVLLDTEGNVIRNLARLGIIRIISFTTQATHYALYTSMMAILCIYRLDIEKRRKIRKRIIIILGLNIINLLFTLTRSTIVCFMVCVALIALKLGVGRFLRVTIPVIIVLLIVSVFFEASFLGQFVYMMLALINPSFADRLSEGALFEYANGVADRLNLYRWVYDSVKDHLVLGVGERTQFAYLHIVDMPLFSYYETKRSIEVYPLYLMYHFGFVGMISEMAMYISLALKTFRSGILKKKQFERRISFNYALFIILLLNITNWFAVAQGEESTTLFILLFVWISYKGLPYNTESESI